MRFDELKLRHPSIPPEMEEALVRHVRGLKEDEMKRKMPLALAFSLALVLLIGTVAAVTYVYSIRPRVPEEKRDQITVINDSHQNQWMKLRILDAYSDGSRMYMALNLEHREGAEPVYLFPEVTAANGSGKSYTGDVESGFELMDGVWLPELWANDQGPGNYAAEMVLYGKDGQQLETDVHLDGPIRWTLRFHVLRLAEGWRMERREAMPDDPGQADALIRAAHRDKLVLLTDPDLAMDFLDRGPLPKGWDKEAWYARPTFERLRDVGAFEEVDRFERVFVTP